MEVVVLVVTGAATAGLAGGAAAAGFGARALGRRNRVSPDVFSIAPPSWLWSPTAPARLHRRLRRTVLGARAAAGGRIDDGTLLGQVAADVERCAVDIDARLVRASRAPKQVRRSAVRQLDAEARSIVQLASRAHHSAATLAPLPALHPAASLPPLAELEQRVAAVEAAVVEVAASAPGHTAHGHRPPALSR